MRLEIVTRYLRKSTAPHQTDGPEPIRFIRNRNRIEDWSVDDVWGSPDTQGIVESIRRKWQLQNELFDALVIPLLKLAAEYFGPLPGSEAHHHAYPCGLLLHSLETTDEALMKIDGAYDPGPIMKGAQLQKNAASYYQSVVLASLLHDVGKVFCDLEVYCTNDREKHWNPYKETVAEFCAKKGSSSIAWKWRAGRHKEHEDHEYALWTAGVWMTRLGLDLTEQVARELVNALNQDEHSIIYDCVRKSDTASVSRDRSTSSHFADQPDSMAVIRPAVRELLSKKLLTINSAKSPVWVTEYGVMLVYPLAFRLIYENLAHAKGMDEEARFEHPDRVRQKMQEAGVIWTYETDIAETAFKVKFKPAGKPAKSKPLFGVIVQTPEVIGLTGLERIDPVALDVAETVPGDDGTVVNLSQLRQKEQASGEGEAKEQAPVLGGGDSADPPQQPKEERPVSAGKGNSSQPKANKGHENQLALLPGEDGPVELAGDDKQAEDAGYAADQGKDGQTEETDELADELFEWIARHVKTGVLTIGTTRQAIDECPGFWDQDGKRLLMNDQPLMMFGGFSTKFSQTPVAEIRKEILKKSYVTEEDGLLLLHEDLAKFIRAEAKDEAHD
jgi:hypothetical protein